MLARCSKWQTRSPLPSWYSHSIQVRAQPVTTWFNPPHGSTNKDEIRNQFTKEDLELQAGIQVTTHRLSYNSLTQPDEPALEETPHVTRTLPHTQSVLGVTARRWYTDGSKRHGRAGGGISNEAFRAAVRVHGPQQVYRAETIACAVASDLAQPRDDIVLDNQGVVKVTPVPRRGIVKDQDYRDPGYCNVTTKNLTVRWTLRHCNLSTATTYHDYIDIQGNNETDTLANMGDNLPMDMPPPQPQDIVLHGHIMPTPAKSWIMQLRRQKQTTDIHWISWIPLKHYRRWTWLPWLWG